MLKLKRMLYDGVWGMEECWKSHGDDDDDDDDDDDPPDVAPAASLHSSAQLNEFTPISISMYSGPNTGWHCKSGKGIKASWKMGVDPPDYQTFEIQVQNTCGLCDAHNVILNLTMLAPGIWDPIVENVRVKHGKPISPGKNVTFSYHVNYLADIGGIHSSARFIHCKLPHKH